MYSASRTRRRRRRRAPPRPHRPPSIFAAPPRASVPRTFGSLSPDRRGHRDRLFQQRVFMIGSPRCRAAASLITRTAVSNITPSKPKRFHRCSFRRRSARAWPSIQSETPRLPDARVDTSGFSARHPRTSAACLVAVTNTSRFAVDARKVVNAATILACISAVDGKVSGAAGRRHRGAGLVAAVCSRSNRRGIRHVRPDRLPHAIHAPVQVKRGIRAHPASCARFAFSALACKSTTTKSVGVATAPSIRAPGSLARAGTDRTWTWTSSPPPERWIPPPLPDTRGVRPYVFTVVSRRGRPRTSRGWGGPSTRHRRQRRGVCADGGPMCRCEHLRGVSGRIRRRGSVAVVDGDARAGVGRSDARGECGSLSGGGFLCASSLPPRRRRPRAASPLPASPRRREQTRRPPLWPRAPPRDRLRRARSASPGSAPLRLRAPPRGFLLRGRAPPLPPPRRRLALGCETSASAFALASAASAASTAATRLDGALTFSALSAVSANRAASARTLSHMAG